MSRQISALCGRAEHGRCMVEQCTCWCHRAPWWARRGQTATEYVLVVLAIGIALFALWNRFSLDLDHVIGNVPVAVPTSSGPSGGGLGMPER